jgi:Tol biopolymer transport system component
MHLPFQISSARILICCVTAVLLYSPFSAAQSEYFGQNKVQYEKFDFKVLETDHYSIYFYPRAERAVRDAARMAERWYERYSDFFNYELKRRNPLVFYANDADFQQTNVISGIIGQGVGGVTEGMKQRVIMPLSGSYDDIDHVLGHELVHMFQYDIDRGSATFSGAGGGINSIPLLFIEGMPEYLTLGRRHPQTAMWMRDAVLHNRLASIDKMVSDYEYFPYRWGHALWAYIGGGWGDEAIPRVYRTALSMGWEAGITRNLKVTVKALSADWNAALKAYYLPLMENRTPPDKIGRLIKGGSDYNIGPSVSPDGRMVAFLSQRDIFTIDLFLADTASGRVIRKLTSSTREQHFDALRFIDSAGAWSPDGRRFAFVAYDKGDNKIVIFNVRDGSIEREIMEGSIGAMYNPAWSPEGERLVFSGIHGGISDLYLYSFRDRSIRRLTDDRFADFQPAWSPDGQTIAFVSDRGADTDFGRLTYSTMGIALMDAENGEIRLLPLFGNAMHTNPQYAPDGRSIYFISDREGFQDIYRLDLDSNTIYQVTRIATGVSGITPLSPALSVSPQSGLLVFSVFQKSDYNLYRIQPDEASGTPVSRTDGNDRGAMLPSGDASEEGAVDTYLRDAATGLPPSDVFPIRDYQPVLKLDYIGLPSIGITSDRYGTALGGGVGALFSDMLGNHTLGIDTQVSGSFENFGAQTYYINRDRRLNWGIVGSRIPYTSSEIIARNTTTIIDGREVDAIELEQIIDQIYVSHLSFNGEYPFSTFRRLDFHAGIMRLDYQSESERVVLVGDQIISDDIRDITAPTPLNLYQVSLGLTGDNSYFGFTSPVRGQRYHISIQPTFGTLRFQEVVADFRRYFFTRNFTLAMRFLHYGYYGQDAENDRLSQLFLGYETLVRGYELGTFDAAECTDPAASECPYPEYNRLLGSKIGVMNLELRVPLLGVPQYGIFTTRYIPTDLVLFADGGMAWSNGDYPVLRNISRNSTERIPVFSAGAAARINLLGYLVTQIYWAYPFQHPNERGHFGFLISPGW